MEEQGLTRFLRITDENNANAPSACFVGNRRRVFLCSFSMMNTSAELPCLKSFSDQV